VDFSYLLSISENILKDTKNSSSVENKTVKVENLHQYKLKPTYISILCFGLYVLLPSFWSSFVL